MYKSINSIQELIESIKIITSKWDSRTTPWFRGEPSVKDTPLLPRLYRPLDGGKKYNENRIVQSFRRMGPGFTKTPERSDTDQWLFLMQHLGVPTRLLDWTEWALIGLYFALQEKRPVLWMLNPDELNQLSTPIKIVPGAYPITWFRPQDNTINIGHENIRAAWELDEVGVDLPVAVKPTYIHSRMSAQKSCFTVHGKRKEPLSRIVPDEILAKFVIHRSAILPMRRDLTMLGITHTSVFPEAEFLAKELNETAMIYNNSEGGE